MSNNIHIMIQENSLIKKYLGTVANIRGLFL